MDDELVSLELRLPRSTLRRIDGIAWREQRSRRDVARDLVDVGLRIEDLRLRFAPYSIAERRTS